MLCLLSYLDKQADASNITCSLTFMQHAINITLLRATATSYVTVLLVCMDMPCISAAVCATNR